MKHIPVVRALRVPALVVSTIFVFVVACATVPPAQQEARVEELIAFVNAAEAEALLEQSGRPFLLDSEIIEPSNDVYVMWRNMIAAGWALPGGQIIGISPVNEHTYRSYGSGLEMESYFSRRLPEGSAVVRVQTRQATWDLLLGGQRDGMPLIYGIRGPL
ncbi:MAG: hypothetical protein EA383_09350 [Spirochaetaceae bacterium]|nr:MAG: hypothetical protein EA383_09350 [Spirochaetaceae bacterium]